MHVRMTMREICIVVDGVSAIWSFGLVAEEAELVISHAHRHG